MDTWRHIRCLGEIYLFKLHISEKSYVDIKVSKFKKKGELNVIYLKYYIEYSKL